MTDRPMIFSAPMVRAILACTKTQTRRALGTRTQPPASVTDFCTFHKPKGDGLAHFGFDPVKRELLEWFAVCPYGQPGDRIWVRETWAAGRQYDHQKPRDITPLAALNYRADQDCSGLKLRTAIHMPRWASRIRLPLVSVRIERLQDISEADALAEGIERLPDPVIDGGWSGPNRFTLKGMGSGACAGLVSWNAPTATELYFRLWETINGPGSVEANPWVWVIEFKPFYAPAA